MLPDLPSSLIEARGKADGLAKILICLQILWMFIQTIARKAYGLPITLLEIHTLTHIVAAIMLYGIWWYKPQGIAEAFVIDLGECETCIRTVLSSGTLQMDEGEKGMMSDSPYHTPTGSVSGYLLVFALLGITNGAVHATAWNAHFPSLVEHQLWRIASCVMGGVCVIICVFYSGADDYIESRSKTCGDWTFGIGFGLFYLSRLYLVVEAFISVRSLPVGAYDTIAWVTFLPHIG